MREADAKRLRPGDRVQFQDDMPNDDNGSLGTVTERDYSRFRVEWDDGVNCSYPHILAMAIKRA
jgi:hypothetical protein